ncbi:Alpha/Beta hydrolase protein [Apiospora saccharicola]|uniref:Alpha/Beta hydrolase protein n=1 Tax=Apiospora saccharicola TaxID=335842 RepID=A0ABR1UPW7_9PEZI
MRSTIYSSAVSCLAAVAAAQTAPIWETLPPTPQLPGSPAGTLSDINGVKIWHAEFGTAVAGQVPVLMLHGGFGNSDYYGDVVKTLMAKHRVIVMDTRGHGRSTMDSTPFTYELYASDASALLETLGVPKAAWVGWSDMAIGTFAALLDSHNRTLVDRAFAFGGGHNPQSTNATFTSSATYAAFITRATKEYAALQPKGDLKAFAAAVETLESTQPNWTEADFAKIKLGAKVTIADGQYEEAVALAEPALLNNWIAGSQRVTLTNVSHFAPLQDPDQFAAKVEEFLAA